ncbi:single-stranded DNA-binding protein [Kroppenstedtia eburnea]|uniref:Single-stranded DNA-binding protein n=1 Tax=Kroppenstedtia eburnea TaxID=714067 RepID=A0A1N7JI13_9BACL|nr:single-stranded DNA-binding protein [Kroppenstedtia eburnea]EGK10370.1 single-strand binding protein [Desmospora sp. 8437]QKI83590.1 single-stranded DNA-binding protein [Kroppenstedtia eburnea]SIS48948.1 single-strand binding protein [Kroppenstedtia eburnea]
MLNRVVLIGRLTRDPELRYTPGGVAVTSFNLAVNRRFTNQQGDREADFIDIVAWRQLAETVANYMKKGRLVAVEGRLQIRSYENQEGRRIKVAEVVAENVQFLESRSQAGSGSGYNQDYGNSGFEKNQDNRGPSTDPFADDGKPIDISDDDLPF